ncbi:head-to-tail connector protein [Gordonia phage Eyre]|uniref:Head-to-tail connector protein n=1 Tax=Gordonia phage Eyre TaxID=1887646 RepID=A0A1B3AZX7_9CAUD|nr:head-tail adaptor [Gordonia phage Eyre]AOE44288.1 head-to-tail connector protein [Gordonia phage Eyre]
MIDFSGAGELVQPDALPSDLSSHTGTLAAVCDDIRRYCGWHIAPVIEDAVVTLDHLGDRVLTLPTLHVVDVTSIVDADGNAIEGWTWSDDGLLHRERGWPRGYRSVRVTFSHGLAATPRGLVDVALDMVRDRVNAAANADELQVTSASLDGATVGFGAPSDLIGVRRDLGRAYGHVLNRFQR